MSITIDLPPAMAQEAREFVTVRGTTLERMFLDYLATELKRRREADAVMSRLDELARGTSARPRTAKEHQQRRRRRTSLRMTR